MTVTEPAHVRALNELADVAARGGSAGDYHRWIHDPMFAW
jgi:hypothetical protein